MTAKRVHSPELVPNPFIKKRNLEWSINLAKSVRDTEDNISPASDTDTDAAPLDLVPPSPIPKVPEPQPSHRSAEVEADKVQISDHPTYFQELLGRQTLCPYPAGQPHLTAAAQGALYTENFGSAHGAHFVVHQHDHPVAGTHYDLRLQIGELSSASWALPYGPPGDANSTRPNRYAVETRVHTLWNHLVETASAATGSLLIWDTGTYEILPLAGAAAATPGPGSIGPVTSRAGSSTRRLRTRSSRNQPAAADPDSQDSALPLPPPPSPGQEPPAGPTEQEKLHAAFGARKIRLRLHGTRLPPDYVVNLRLTRTEDLAVRARAPRSNARRRRRSAKAARAPEPVTSSDSEPMPEPEVPLEPGSAAGQTGEGPGDEEQLSAMERELRELEDEEVRRTNAYPGATNSIGSIHQRKWFLSLDKEACGFVRQHVGGKIVWEQETAAGTDGGNTSHNDERLTFPFYVRGPEVERSVITGRQAEDVMRDEGVVRFVRRKGWQPILV
jgi:hypothetical protein